MSKLNKNVFYFSWCTVLGVDLHSGELSWCLLGFQMHRQALVHVLGDEIV